jgi:putative ABC transport system substrate-binding protein
MSARSCKAKAGWVIGRNAQLEYRWTEGNPDNTRKYIAELVALAPDVIVAQGASAVRAISQATRTVPIVFLVAGDPVGAGIVETFARPGGNVTSFMNFEYGTSAKWLELLKRIAPSVTRVAVLRDPATPTGVIEAAASAFHCRGPHRTSDHHSDD